MACGTPRRPQLPGGQSRDERGLAGRLLDTPSPRWARVAGDGRGRWRGWREMRRVGRAVKPHRAHGGERAEGRGHPAARQLPTLTSAPRPSRQPGAGGARRRGGGGWRGHGRAAPAHLALPPPLLRQDSELRPPSLQGQAVMACGDTPPAMSPPHPCCPHTAPAPLSAPRPPSASTNTPVTTPGIAHHPQWLSVPSPFAQFSHHRLFITPQCPSPAQFAHHSKCLYPPDLQFPSQIHLPAFHPTRDPPSLISYTISPLHPNTLYHPNTPYPFQASPGDTPFVIVGSPICGRGCGCPLTALLEAVAAELGAEGGTAVQGPLRWAQALVGCTCLAQCPVALGQLGQRLGFQQGLAAGGHGRGHSWSCKDSRAVGITVSSLCSSAQATPVTALEWVGREHDKAVESACCGRVFWVLGCVLG